MKSTVGSFRFWTFAVGDVVVLQGLPVEVRRPDGDKLPPRVGRITKIIGDGGEFYVRLSIGRGHYTPYPRRVAVANVVRKAFPREIVLGHPVGPLAEAVLTMREAG